MTVAVTPGATSYGDCLRLLRTHVSTSSTIAAVERASNVVDQRNRIKVIEMHKVQGVERGRRQAVSVGGLDSRYK